MFYKIPTIAQLVIISITITSICCYPSQIFQTPSQCRNQNKNSEQSCMKSYCNSNQETFVCQSLKCKNDFPGSGISDNMGKLNCINRVCDANPNESVCKQLRKCEAKKNQGFGGLFAYIDCVIKLFS